MSRKHFKSFWPSNESIPNSTLTRLDLAPSLLIPKNAAHQQSAPILLPRTCPTSGRSLGNNLSCLHLNTRKRVKFETLSSVAMPTYQQRSCKTSRARITDHAGHLRSLIPCILKFRCCHCNFHIVFETTFHQPHLDTRSR